MADRVCPICGAQLRSYVGVSLRQRAKEHYIVAHRGTLTLEEGTKWRIFYDSMPLRRTY